jgi:hypothetical protein
MADPNVGNPTWALYMIVVGLIHRYPSERLAAYPNLLQAILQFLGYINVPNISLGCGPVIFLSRPTHRFPLHPTFTSTYHAKGTIFKLEQTSSP